MPNRKRIPNAVADSVIFESDRTCCVCQNPHKPVQVHHLDGDHSNYEPRNLAVLCLDHHDEATRGPGLGRGLSAGQIRLYRDAWLRRVRGRRGSPSKFISHDALLEAMACHEIRRIRTQLLTRKWDARRRLLKELNGYTDFRYGFQSRSEALAVLADLADQTRNGMPAEMASEISELAQSLLPIFSLVNCAVRKPATKDIDLLSQALELGSTMAYDAARYMGDISIAASGSRVVWCVLRYSHLNKLTSLKKKALGEFAFMEEHATKAHFEDARRWFAFEKLDALALRDDELPEYPVDVAAKIDAKEASSHEDDAGGGLSYDLAALTRPSRSGGSC